MKLGDGMSYEFGLFRLNVAEHTLLRDGHPVQLTPKVFEVLVCLFNTAAIWLKRKRCYERSGPTVSRAVVEDTIVTSPVDSFGGRILGQIVISPTLDPYA
jgi:DNA-binding response OmpR family regulator